MKFYTTVNDKRKLLKRWKALIIVCSILVVLALSIGIWAIYNYVKRDYNDKGKSDYLKSIENTEIKEKKNIVLILLDDMGFGDLSLTGSEAIETPNIDALASNGIFFTNYYSPNPICSASRAGMLTGRIPVRTLTCGAYMDTETFGGHMASLLQVFLGTYPYANQGLPTDEILLSDVLQTVGYHTGLFGKWHLGVKDKERPNNRGFDDFYGALYSDDMAPYRVYDNEKVVHNSMTDQSNLTKELTQQAIEFVDDSLDKEEPFFLYYASPYPHWPPQCSEEWKGSSKAGTYGDAMQEVDWSIGQIVDKLEEEGILEDTLILFTSDNGPWYEGDTAEGDRGRKSTKYNGGSHVPLIASMVGTLPEGKEEGSLISGLDIFPTILDMLNINLPTDRIIDGISMWDAWREISEPTREFVFINDKKDEFALIEGHFKYIQRCASDIGAYWNLSAGPFLYDLSVDESESYDVSMLYPDVAESMKNKVDAIKKELKENIRGWIK